MVSKQESISITNQEPIITVEQSIDDLITRLMPQKDDLRYDSPIEIIKQILWNYKRPTKDDPFQPVPLKIFDQIAVRMFPYKFGLEPDTILFENLKPLLERTTNPQDIGNPTFKWISG